MRVGLWGVCLSVSETVSENMLVASTGRGGAREDVDFVTYVVVVLGLCELQSA
jgi:hypothetical protein